MFKKLSPYWTCQILGWGAIIPYWLYYEPKVAGYAIPILFLLLEVAVQIFFTDQYRGLAHRKKWINRSLRGLFPVIFVAWVVLSLQYVGLNYFLYVLRFGPEVEGDILLGMAAGGTRYHAIWLLAFHLYHFAKRSAREAAASARFAQLAAEAQLAKLNTELNPHFLFNALNSVKALTREDPAQARNAIDQLADLLRYSLRQSRKEYVLLSEEIEIVKDYLQLEKIRLEERLQISWEVEEPLLDCQMPPLSLHCLVENGIKHGIALLPKGGQLAIKIYQETDSWILQVDNSGSYNAKSERGTGLTNLRQRLQLLYHDQACFSIENHYSKVSATIQLPLK